jgi:hypothetical protein
MKQLFDKETKLENEPLSHVQPHQQILLDYFIFTVKNPRVAFLVLFRKSDKSP